MNNNPLKTTPPQLIAILVIIFLLFAYGLYLSKLAERRCIIGAEKAGNTSQEIKNWCRNTF